MTARVVRESYDGGRIEVEAFDFARRPYAHPSAAGRIVLGVIERGMGQATLYLTRVEAMDLAAVLLLAIEDIDATQTAPVGAGAAPTADASGAPLGPGGNTRTQATGLSGPTPEPGRPNFDPTAIVCQPIGWTVAGVLNSAREELLANSTPVGRSNPSVCEHGYRFENALCPLATCGASAYLQATTTFSPIGGSAVTR